jgi:glycerate-2-kinase
VSDAAARGILVEMFAAAVTGADPGAATTAALARRPLRASAGRRLWLMAAGKAAPAMAEAAVRALDGPGRPTLAGGVVIAAHPAPSPHPELELVVGDHPVPAAASRDAAMEIAAMVARMGIDDQALVLLSGGATSLMAAPVTGVDAADVAVLFTRLLGAGVDIGVMNQVRKRVLRWAGGRLAGALAPSPVRCLLVSDVAGDDPATIASGPCEPDPLTASAVLDLIERMRLQAATPPAIRAYLAAVARGAAPETPKPGDRAFAGVTTEVVLANRDALRAAVTRATALQCTAELAQDELAGEAREAGRRVAERLLQERARGGTLPRAVVWGGETTVTLPLNGVGVGGRCQELALAAAARLHEAGAAAHGLWVLAAGTDGRDGPTDAAGALVSAATWTAAQRAGQDPAVALRAHDAYGALRAADALLPARATGTNVRDVVIGLVDG